MFLRRFSKRKNGKLHSYWALVESYRTIKGSRQRVVSYLGELKATEQSGWAQLCSNLDKPKGKSKFKQLSLFDPPECQDDAEKVEAALVTLKGVRLQRMRDFGDVWLAWGIWRLLGLDQLLDSVIEKGKEEVPWHIVAAILSIARFCHPSSELHIETTWYRQTALEDLLQVPPEKIHTDRLYSGLDQLLPHKETIEKHLKERLGKLFKLDYEIMLYDVTSTYFEGQCKSNPQAKRGYSRDQRPDCLQVCIALIVTTDGMPVGYEVFAGNRHDSADRREKEKAIHERFIARMEAGLKKIQTAIDSGKLREEKIAYYRLGRLRAENSRAGKAFNVQINPIAPATPSTPEATDKKTSKKDKVKPTLTMTWTRDEQWNKWATLSEGCYLLRSNLTETDPKILWKHYIQLTDAEWAFRIAKDELVLRPIWHHKEERVKAHILVCFMAYAMWKTLAAWMNRSGLGDAPRSLLDEISKIKSGDIVLPLSETKTVQTRELSLRCVTEPDQSQKLLLRRLGVQLPKRLGSRFQTPKCSEDF